MMWSVLRMHWSMSYVRRGSIASTRSLALKALVKRSAAQPHVLIGEIVPLCITHYYEAKP